MPRLIDSATDCKLLHSNLTKDNSATVLLHARLNVICQKFNVPDLKRENMLLVASELASNNIKHAAGKGQIQIWQQPGPVLDIVSLDYGPGITNLSLAEQDGYSTANTFGKGLGAIRRLSDESHFYSQAQQIPGKASRWNGAIFMARFYLSAAIPNIGLFSRALSDTLHNGDRIYLQHKGEKLRWLHLDGIGHGEEAQQTTSDMAKHITPYDTLPHILQQVEQQLQPSRGAVAVTGELDLAQHQLQLLGVGDIHGHLYQQQRMQHIAFAAGILGREHRRPELLQTHVHNKAVLLIASDGIRRNWDENNFPGLFELHPQLIAYTVGNIMGRSSDDQSILVAAAN